MLTPTKHQHNAAKHAGKFILPCAHIWPERFCTAASAGRNKCLSVYVRMCVCVYVFVLWCACVQQAEASTVPNAPKQALMYSVPRLCDDLFILFPLISELIFLSAVASSGPEAAGR